MTGRPPVSDHVLLRDPGLRDLCRPVNLHHPYHGTLHHDLLGHLILYPAPQDMSAEAAWVPQAISRLVQNLPSEGSNSLGVPVRGKGNTAWPL